MSAGAWARGKPWPRAGLECDAAAVECSISGGVRGHAALQALEQFAAARRVSHARGEWSSAAAPRGRRDGAATALAADARRGPRLDEPAAGRRG